MELTVSLETICRLIMRARELEAQVPGNENDDDEPTDSDDPLAVLEAMKASVAIARVRIR